MISSLTIIIIIALAISVSVATLMVMNGGLVPAISTQQKKTEHCRTYIQHLEDEEDNGKIKTECFSA